MKYNNIIFDLDGTLWDTASEIAHSWQKALKDLPDIEKLPTSKDLEKVMGLPADELMAGLFPHLSPERGIEIFNYVAKIENAYLREHGGNLYDGLIEVLEKLSKTHKLFIVSNCNDGYIDSFLAAHNTGKFFTDYECVGRTGLLKVDNIKLVIERNQLENTVYVGDTALDYSSATKAGIPFIFAAYGFGSVEGTPKINSLTELLDMV